MIIFNLAAIPSIIINVLLFWLADTYVPVLSNKYNIFFIVILIVVNIPIDYYIGSRIFFLPISVFLFLAIFFKIYTDYGIIALLATIIVPIIAMVIFVKNINNNKNEKEDLENAESEKT